MHSLLRFLHSALSRGGAALGLVRGPVRLLAGPAALVDALAPPAPLVAGLAADGAVGHLMDARGAPAGERMPFPNAAPPDRFFARGAAPARTLQGAGRALAAAAHSAPLTPTSLSSR